MIKHFTTRLQMLKLPC
uniref:Uncharacterized protein n=1 Tax=Arundo donax TaxID=35708 RepID=A0A0A8Y7D2_ARUDO